MIGLVGQIRPVVVHDGSVRPADAPPAPHPEPAGTPQATGRGPISAVHHPACRALPDETGYRLVLGIILSGVVAAARPAAFSERAAAATRIRSALRRMKPSASRWS